MAEQNLHDFSKWQHLLYVAEKLREESCSNEDVKTLLSSLEIYFPRTLNPVDDFRGYAARHFFKAITEIIKKRE